ncbi:EAL domain-containing protein [Kineococcus sp. GCM10028916]|uniref:EAL domain-containing protein n=1 Tax=Kineococcus sp. GCM10028916 TaxID=3273394 RepID=UPI00363CE793
MSLDPRPGAPVLSEDSLPDLLERLCPFYLLVDHGGRATRVGPSLAKVCPDLDVGDPVAATLRITTPRDLTWERCGDELPRGLVLVETGRGQVLRGQVLPTGEGTLFVGTPWVTSMSDLLHLGLRLDDFAPADPVTDFLLLLGAQASALSDAQLLATQLQDIAAAHAHRASHDSLTGLPNRTSFAARLDEELRVVQAGGGSAAVVLLDLDRFKEINDTLGHRCGDLLLQQVGPRVQGVLRAGEFIARLGGDEFALLITSPHRGAAALADHRSVAERVLDALREPFVVGELTLLVAASAGIAMSPEHGSTGELLLQHADVAMYLAKAQHLDLAAYSSGLDAHEPRRLTLLSQLRTAADTGELVLHYQPLLHLPSREVRGVEALVRWQHPQEGLLLPSDFVPLAESSGLVQVMTARVLSQACAQASAWLAAGRPLVVSVNVSARSLVDATLPESVAENLAVAGLPAHLLKLEITESAVIADPVRAQDVLARLRDLGVGLSVDDFGTGYTSLAHLRQLPVQELKIDRSFVTTMLSEPRNAVIVQTGVELATRLGLTSVGEGVEDAATLEALAALGCTTAQGFHLARPLPPAALERWLTAWTARRPAP